MEMVKALIAREVLLILRLKPFIIIRTVQVWRSGIDGVVIEGMGIDT